MYDLLLRGGDVVLPTGMARVDVAVIGGVIAEIGDLRGESAWRTIDVSGAWVVPGLIDPHLHIADVASATGARAVDDFTSATIAAALSGVTTVIDFAYPVAGQLPAAYLAERRAEADGHTVLDYSLHVVVDTLDEETLVALGDLPSLGCRSFKAFMHRGGMANPATLYRLMRRAAELDMLVMVHAENRELLEASRGQNALTAATFAASRPPLSEALATVQAIHLAEATQCPLYVVHVTEQGSLTAIREARQRGQAVWGEATSHHLGLTEAAYQREDGALFLCAPPLRSAADQAALWAALADGTLQSVCSDHCGYGRDQKEAQPGQSIEQIPPGIAGLQTSMSLILSEGVCQGRMPLTRFVEIASTNPARIFGLYPQKGVIARGSDADLCVIDPHAQWVVDPADLYVPWGWNPFAGRTLRARPVLVMARGELLVEAGRFVGTAGGGRYLHCGAPRAPLFQGKVHAPVIQ